MIALPAGVKVWLVAGATDMRNYADTKLCREHGGPLAMMIETVLSTWTALPLHL